jgi:restriction endonuclease S subunit
MITDLKPYPAMKDSGVEWLGVVPEHWDVLPNRAMFGEIKDRERPSEQMLSVTIKRGVIQQAEFLEDSTKKDQSNLDRSKYKLVQPGDIVYNKMRAWQGAFGVSSYRGIVSPAYIVLRPRSGCDALYFHHLFRTPAYAKEAERWSYGIDSDMWSLRPEHFRLIYACRPPRAEQSSILRYLDHADRRLRRLVRAKRKVIALVAEQTQATIHQAFAGSRSSKWESFPVWAVLRPIKRFGHPDKTLLSLFRDYGVIPKASRENKNVDVRDLALCQLVEVGFSRTSFTIYFGRRQLSQSTEGEPMACAPANGGSCMMNLGSFASICRRLKNKKQFRVRSTKLMHALRKQLTLSIVSLR